MVITTNNICNMLPFGSDSLVCCTFLLKKNSVNIIKNKSQTGIFCLFHRLIRSSYKYTQERKYRLGLPSFNIWNLFVFLQQKAIGKFGGVKTGRVIPILSLEVMIEGGSWTVESYFEIA
jgi:hypothetical protein